jgi:hypothetical protein
MPVVGILACGFIGWLHFQPFYVQISPTCSTKPWLKDGAGWRAPSLLLGALTPSGERRRKILGDVYHAAHTGIFVGRPPDQKLVEHWRFDDRLEYRALNMGTVHGSGYERNSKSFRRETHGCLSKMHFEADPRGKPRELAATDDDIIELWRMFVGHHHECFVCKVTDIGLRLRASRAHRSDSSVAISGALRQRQAVFFAIM